mmetsp:Transcript_96475/g.311533  ORF Transcript_96475/g.311533 Transcript_96475/m.311533 type:complete len:205 (-) Transcript_96475:672-1286(-)
MRRGGTFWVAYRLPSGLGSRPESCACGLRAPAPQPARARQPRSRAQLFLDAASVEAMTGSSTWTALTSRGIVIDAGISSTGSRPRSASRWCSWRCGRPGRRTGWHGVGPSGSCQAGPHCRRGRPQRCPSLRMPMPGPASGSACGGMSSACTHARRAPFTSHALGRSLPAGTGCKVCWVRATSPKPSWHTISRRAALCASNATGV